MAPRYLFSFKKASRGRWRCYRGRPAARVQSGATTTAPAPGRAGLARAKGRTLPGGLTRIGRAAVGDAKRATIALLVLKALAAAIAALIFGRASMDSLLRCQAARRRLAAAPSPSPSDRRDSGAESSNELSLSEELALEALTGGLTTPETLERVRSQEGAREAAAPPPAPVKIASAKQHRAFRVLPLPFAAVRRPWNGSQGTARRLSFEARE